MTERTKTQHQHHIFFCTNPDEAAQIMIAAPVPFSLFRFMVNPEDICRNDIDTTGLHFADFPAPFRLRYAGIVNLAHDGNDMLAVKDKPPEEFCLRVLQMSQTGKYLVLKPLTTTVQTSIKM